MRSRETRLALPSPAHSGRATAVVARPVGAGQGHDRDRVPADRPDRRHARRAWCCSTTSGRSADVAMAATALSNSRESGPGRRGERGDRRPRLRRHRRPAVPRSLQPHPERLAEDLTALRADGGRRGGTPAGSRRWKRPPPRRWPNSRRCEPRSAKGASALALRPQLEAGKVTMDALRQPARRPGRRPGGRPGHPARRASPGWKRTSTRSPSPAWPWHARGCDRHRPVHLGHLPAGSPAQRRTRTG